MDSTVNSKQDSKVGEDDGDSDKSEHSVDAIHQRFQSNVYICASCKQVFAKKSKLEKHYKNECRAVCCLSCLEPMFITRSTSGIEEGHVCGKDVKQHNSRPNVDSHPLSNHQRT